ncbi:hypothetical protein DY000_02013778 [Brassica cretica]|uniref:Uncharacterized protein n=1 Tax=Brassica cretica TaxID=69181 RepID=A0ABQ7CPW1_BRACR|nr:hypothetical protein DY000_02013778 [Brassica cretica]
MILRRWDPGIGKDECDGGDKAYYDNHGERHLRLSPDHGERHRRLDLDIVGTGEGILGNLRKLRIMDDWGLISIIITKSQISEESGFVVVLLWFLTWELMTAPGVGPMHIMVSIWWDPGIGKDECDGGDKAYYDNHGERHLRLSPDHGERHRRLDLDIVGTGEGILGNLRKLRIMDDWGLISIIITKSQISEESGFVVVLLWFLTWELMTAPGVGPMHIMVSIWLLLVVLDHGYRWRRSALHQKEQTGRDNDHSYSLYFFDAGYWCYSRVRIGSIEYIHPTAYVVFFGTVVAVAAFGLYLVEGGKDQAIGDN